MEQISLENRQKSEAILNNVVKLQSIPKILAEILEYLNTDSVNNTKLAKLILGDQNLSTKVLAIANSPLYGLQRTVSTIDFAVMVLGVDELRSIVSSLSMMDTFKNKTDDFLDQMEFWQHSFLVGSLAKKIAEDLSYSFGGEVFTAGFLHDIGLPIMHKYFHSAFENIINETEYYKKPFISAELSNIGFSHSEIGHKLLDKWNLPMMLCDVVLNHHQPLSSDKYTKQTAVVHLADYATKHLNVGSYFWDQDLELDTEIIKKLGFVDEQNIHDTIETYSESLKEQLESTRFLF